MVSALPLLWWEKKTSALTYFQEMFTGSILWAANACPRSFHLLLAALAIIVVLFFCLLQMYDLRHLSTERWQLTSRNGYAAVLRLLEAPQWAGTRIIVFDFTPGGFMWNVLMIPCHFLMLGVFCLWSYFHSEWLVKGVCVSICAWHLHTCT